MDLVHSLTSALVVSALLCVASIIALVHSRKSHPRRSPASQLDQLRKVPFLKDLTPENLSEIAKVVRELLVPPDVYILREERLGDAMYIVVSGTLHILKRGAHDQTLLQTVGPGDVVGEMALLNDARRVASARAVTASSLLQIDRDDFFELLGRQPALARAVGSACEVHAIDLSLADHAATRALSPAERNAWIASRRSEVFNSEQKIFPKGKGYLAVVSGKVVDGDHEHAAPALLRVLPTQELRVLPGARICWLDGVVAR